MLEETCPSEAVQYKDVILQTIEKENLSYDGSRSLIVYFDEDKTKELKHVEEQNFNGQSMEGI